MKRLSIFIFLLLFFYNFSSIAFAKELYVEKSEESTINSEQNLDFTNNKIEQESLLVLDINKLLRNNFVIQVEEDKITRILLNFNEINLDSIQKRLEVYESDSINEIKFTNKNRNNNLILTEKAYKTLLELIDDLKIQSKTSSINNIFIEVIPIYSPGNKYCTGFQIKQYSLSSEIVNLEKNTYTNLNSDYPLDRNEADLKNNDLKNDNATIMGEAYTENDELIDDSNTNDQIIIDDKVGDEELVENNEEDEVTVDKEEIIMKEAPTSSTVFSENPNTGLNCSLTFLLILFIQISIILLIINYFTFRDLDSKKGD